MQRLTAAPISVSQVPGARADVSLDPANGTAVRSRHFPSSTSPDLSPGTCLQLNGFYLWRSRNLVKFLPERFQGIDEDITGILRLHCESTSVTTPSLAPLYEIKYILAKKL